jgi:hypothetical protein
MSDFNILLYKSVVDNSNNNVKIVYPFEPKRQRNCNNIVFDDEYDCLDINKDCFILDSVVNYCQKTNNK